MIDYPPRFTLGRARTLLEQVIRPAVFSPRIPLAVEVFQCAEPISYADAIKQTYKPVELGFTWGPIWSTAWFRLRGTVPQDFGDSFRLLFDTRTEALCWWDGSPYQGVELHRQDVKLPKSVKPGDAIEVYVEAACNHMLGVGPKFGDFARLGEFPYTQSGKLVLAHVARYNPKHDALLQDVECLINLVDAMPEGTPRKRQAASALRDACTALIPEDLDNCLDQVRAICTEALAVSASGGANTAYCVGHAHIDLAWLWPVRETKRKCARTFSTVLRNMEKHKRYRFIQSQPQAYEWVRQNYPKLFDEIKAQVKEGRWEAAGAMWVESDCNIPSGESLARQLLYGIRYFEQTFGTKQTYLWLPDVFGYSAALPQIMKHAGLRAFITMKISWNQFNTFPNQSFNWVGIDGTVIPSHFMPSNNYNSENTAQELKPADDRYAQAGVFPAYLQSYGHGDGGGGPTEAQIGRVDRYADCDGLPRMQHASVEDFIDKLVEASPKLPKWDGELYLERHRGTYTSHASMKRSNRLGEAAFKALELLHAVAGVTDDERAAVLQLWRDFLFNQFHDVIPGSSIEWVNREAREQYARVLAGIEQLTDTAAKRVTTSGGGDSWLILNTRTHGDGGLVELPDGTTLLAPDTDAPGISVTRGVAPGELSFDAKTLTMENAHLRVTLDATGRVTSLVDKATGREAVPAGDAMNKLTVYTDRPISQEGWAVDIFYHETGKPLETPVEMKVVEQGPMRVTVEFRRSVGQASKLVQRVSLVAGGKCVTFHTTADWSEGRTMLRVLNPVDVRCDYATYEVQFGYVRRANHFNTSWDVARFESCAQRWADFSEPGFGVTMLNDCKYGHTCHGNVLGLSLLRGPREPDETADIGTFEFTYALMPHGSFDPAQATRVAEVLNQPLLAWPASGDVMNQPVRVTGPHADAVVIESIKPAEDGVGFIVRLRESRGGRGSVTLHADGAIVGVDLIERVLDGAGEAAKNERSFTIKPFEICSFLVR